MECISLRRDMIRDAHAGDRRSEITVSRANIALTREQIGSYIRRTPIIDVDGADLGLTPTSLVLKLESLQYAGSFKTGGRIRQSADARRAYIRCRCGVGRKSCSCRRVCRDETRHPGID